MLLDDVECMPFTGPSGHALAIVIIVLALSVCALAYRYQRQHGTERRPLRVYIYDMSKIVISLLAAWVVNMTMTALAFEEFQAQQAQRSLKGVPKLHLTGIGWYASVFTLDFVIGVPVGLGFAALTSRLACWYWLNYARPYANRSVVGIVLELKPSDVDPQDLPPESEMPCLVRLAEQNAVLGKYGREHTGENDEEYDSWGPALNGSWWCTQCFVWSVCVALSRVVSGGLLLLSLQVIPFDWNVLLWLATWISEWPMSCGAKQWVVAGLMRTSTDVAQYLIVDLVNKLHPDPEDSYKEV